MSLYQSHPVVNSASDSPAHLRRGGEAIVHHQKHTIKEGGVSSLILNLAHTQQQCVATRVASGVRLRATQVTQ